MPNRQPSRQPNRQPNRQQRDLAWSIQQPALIKEAELWPGNEWFANLPTPIIDSLEPPPPKFRLGIHFEKIFQQWLNTQPDFSTVAANLQVHGEGRTLGEFDLLVEGLLGIEHWELAVKFYINQQDPEDPASWFGPDPADTLGSKLHRLTSHQLKLSSLPAARALLDSLGIQLSAERCIMKGRLYHPWKAYHENEYRIPANVNPDHCKGWWLHSEHLDVLGNEKLVYLDKRLWLSEVTDQDVIEVMDLNTLIHFVEQSSQIALQFALLDKDKNETSRGFILKPDWFRRAH